MTKEKSKMIDVWLALPDTPDKPSLPEFTKRWEIRSNPKKAKRIKNQQLYKYIRSFPDDIIGIGWAAYCKGLIRDPNTIDGVKEIIHILISIGKKKEARKLYKHIRIKSQKYHNQQKGRINRILRLSTKTEGILQLHEGEYIEGVSSRYGVKPPSIIIQNGCGYLTIFNYLNIPTTTKIRSIQSISGTIIVW